MTLLTIKEVAARLKISVSLAYRLVASGELPSYAIGACKRVGEEDLGAFLQRQRSTSRVVPRGAGKHF